MDVFTCGDYSSKQTIVDSTENNLSKSTVSGEKGGLPTFIGYMMSRTISVSKGGGKLLSYQENSLFGSGYGSDFVFSTETCIFSVSYTVPK